MTPTTPNTTQAYSIHATTMELKTFQRLRGMGLCVGVGSVVLRRRVTRLPRWDVLLTLVPTVLGQHQHSIQYKEEHLCQHKTFTQLNESNSSSTPLKGNGPGNFPRTATHQTPSARKTSKKRNDEYLVPSKHRTGIKLYLSTYILRSVVTISY